MNELGISRQNGEALSGALSRFDEIVFADTEFIPRPSEKPDPVAVCAKELRSGRTFTLFADELGPTPPYRIDDRALFVSFAAAAELETHLALSWPLPANVLDLRVEHIIQTNAAAKNRDGSSKKQPRSLLDVLRSYKIPDGDAKVKADTVVRILQGHPFNAEERARILRYCFSDALALEPLFRILVARIANIDQALRRGEYVALTAEICDFGIPFDPLAMQWLGRRDIRQLLRLRLVSDEKLTQGIYDDKGSLKQKLLKEFVIRHGLDWPTVGPEGKKRLSTKDEIFEELAKVHPEFGNLAEIKKTLSMLREFELAIGRDGRCRTPIWGFSTITSRMAPNGSAYPFTTAAWTRNLITPQPGTALVYLDFSSMEFGVAAGLSRCRAMIEAYERGDPYVGLRDRAGLSFIARDRIKPIVLSLQYGGGVLLIMGRLGVSRQQAQRLRDLHHRDFAGYWRWSDNQILKAYSEGRLIARDGWRCRVNSRTSEFTVRNWLIQANAAAIFRYAGLMTRRIGLRICAVVHDAILIEVPADRIEVDTARAVDCLERASRMFLYGLTLRADAKVIREGERFADERGIKVWAHVERTLAELSGAEV
jgi:DNA polymerase-1